MLGRGTSAEIDLFDRGEEVTRISEYFVISVSLVYRFYCYSGTYPPFVYTNQGLFRVSCTSS